MSFPDELGITPCGKRKLEYFANNRLAGIKCQILTVRRKYVGDIRVMCSLPSQESDAGRATDSGGTKMSTKESSTIDEVLLD